MRPEIASDHHFENTLSKALVHKVSVDQVLLTDYKPVSETETTLYAQLPRAHGFYCEHVVDPNRFDIAALIEICRQACFVVAHTQFGVAMEGVGYQFLFQELHAALLAPRKSIITDDQAGKPVQLVVNSQIEKQAKKASGTTYALIWVYTIETADGFPVARIRIRQTWLPRATWREIRQVMKLERGITPDQGIPVAPTSHIAPADVGRFNPHNVVLLDVRVTGDHLFEAEARIDTQHPVLFDRTTEHIYAMIQIEVCRQLALYAVSKTLGVTAAELDLHEILASFDTIGELQLPASAFAEVKIIDPATGDVRVAATLKQQGRSISVFDIGIRRLE